MRTGRRNADGPGFYLYVNRIALMTVVATHSQLNLASSFFRPQMGGSMVEPRCWKGSLIAYAGKIDGNQCGLRLRAAGDPALSRQCRSPATQRSNTPFSRASSDLRRMSAGGYRVGVGPDVPLHQPHKGAGRVNEKRCGAVTLARNRLHLRPSVESPMRSNREQQVSSEAESRPQPKPARQNYRRSESRQCKS